ncbi:MAG: molybdopterin-dependent oxidoreductase [Actinomycetota bacterium]
MADYGKPDDGFTHLTTSLEYRGGDLGTIETPIDRFFVCNASDAPTIDRDSWRLRICGDAAMTEVEIDWDALSALPQVDQLAWIECAGNGRSMFTLVDGQVIPPENAHTGWMLGGLGLARWSGPTLASVLDLAGVGPDAAWVSPMGLDEENTEGEPARMCLPLDKALDPTTMVATTMNGEPLLRAHGAPVRLLVPGWVGAYSVKWLGELTISSSWVPSWRADEYYVDRDPDSTILGPVTAHPVKSHLALEFPGSLPAGRNELFGYARSGDGAITAVEWSIDGGEWQPAQLDPTEGRWAWTVFRFEVDLAEGEHVVRTRATDSTGAQQPDQQPFHPYGVLWSSIVPHPISSVG